MKKIEYILPAIVAVGLVVVGIAMQRATKKTVEVARTHYDKTLDAINAKEWEEALQLSLEGVQLNDLDRPDYHYAAWKIDAKQPMPDEMWLHSKEIKEAFGSVVLIDRTC